MYGGFFIDANVLVLKSLESVWCNKVIWLSSAEITNQFFCFEKSHEILNLAMMTLAEATDTASISAGLLTAAAIRYHKNNGDNWKIIEAKNFFALDIRKQRHDIYGKSFNSSMLDSSFYAVNWWISAKRTAPFSFAPGDISAELMKIHCPPVLHTILLNRPTMRTTMRTASKPQPLVNFQEHKRISMCFCSSTSISI